MQGKQSSSRAVSVYRFVNDVGGEYGVTEIDNVRSLARNDDNNNEEGELPLREGKMESRIHTQRVVTAYRLPFQ